MANEQREFWSMVAQKYDQVVDLQIGALTRSMMRERVGKEGRLGKLAEFGCGTGFYTQVLVGTADTVIATDVSPGMLALAQERIKAANVRSRWKTAKRRLFLPRPLIRRSLAW
jgi:ABC-2 type transport system ATP-binding protein